MVGTIEERDSEGRWVVQAKEILRMIERGEDVEIENRVIKGDIDLTKINLPKIGRGESIDCDHRLNQIAKREKVVVKSSIEIKYSEIQGFVIFNNSIFNKIINFRGTTFNKVGSFVNSVFCRDSNFLESHFIGNANFGGTVFYRGPSFSAVNFEKNASFDLAEFKSEPSFNGAYFKRDATFNYAIFCKSVYFVGVNFGGDANYTKTTFNKPVYLKEAIFSRFNVEWRQIKDKIACDGATYLLLVRSFKNLEQFDNADDCYYDYREWRRNSNDVSTEKRSNWSKLYDFVSYASCGYGVRLRFPLAWIFGSILGFAALYRIFDGILKSSPAEITMISLNNSTMLFSSAYAETAPSFWECLYFSSLSFAGGTPVGLSPVGVWKYAVMMESVLGYLFLALFVVVLARKLIR